MRTCDHVGHLEQSERDILTLRSQQGRFEERIAMMQHLLEVRKSLCTPTSVLHVGAVHQQMLWCILNPTKAKLQGLLMLYSCMVTVRAAHLRCVSTSRKGHASGVLLWQLG